MPDGSIPIPARNGLAAAMETCALELLGQPAQKKGTTWYYGSRGSLKVDLARGLWNDFESGQRGGVLYFVMHHARCDKPGAMQWLQDRGLAPSRQASKSKQPPRIVATYDYTDAHGALLYQVVRLDPKDFRQRRPDDAGGWTWSTRGMALVPYRLVALQAALAARQPVFLVEGEKAADMLAKVGLAATCSPGGANKWRPSYSPFFAGADVVILPDNDDPGRQHAASVAGHLKGVAARVRILTLPDLPPKGDVADWLAAGGTAAELQQLAGAAPDAEAAAQPKREEPTRAEDVELTEEGIARHFEDLHRHDLRFCEDTGQWHRWTGTHWAGAMKGEAFTAARDLVRTLNRGAEARARFATGRAGFVGGIETFLKKGPLAIPASRLDSDPLLLGTPLGTVDLRTGTLRPSDRGEYITRQAAVGPAAPGTAPDRWLRFLDDATGKDDDLIRFLQAWCGYCLTGSTREHALVFTHGSGGNGKSVFANTVQGIMGDYAAVASMDTFVAAQGDRHPADLAMLRGARLVTASETEEGRAWAESRIKQMTGGDPITARFMRQDFFTYRPQFKLFIIGNHKPVLRNVDDAARRRFNLVPFTRKPASPDRQLEDKLKAEWPAILRWMIEGCLIWQREGLPRPAAVVEATNDYFAAQDTFGQWLAECCDLLPDASTRPGQLLGAYRQWCEANGHAAPDSKSFRGMVERVGLTYRTVRGYPFVRGVRVLEARELKAKRQEAEGGEG